MSEQNNFEDLKQLLKLKQHEIPPPGYFNNFSGEVLSRIRAGEAGGSKNFFERLEQQSPWLFNVLRIFETKPGMIGGFATSLCLLLLIGVVMAERPDAPSPVTSAFGGSEPQVSPGMMAAVNPTENSGITISTNPVVSLQPAAAPFGQTANPLFQNASFMPSGQ